MTISLTQSIFLVVSIGAVVFLVTLLHHEVRPSLRKYPIKKIAWAVLAICAGYWFVSVPYVGSFYDFSTKLKFPQQITRETPEGEYIRDHHHRIERLEDELKETKEELQELRKHYQDVVNIGLYAILFYTSMLIFKKKKDEPDDEVVKLNLNE